VSLTTDVTSAVVGGDVTYFVTLQNTSDVARSGFAVTDQLGLEYGTSDFKCNVGGVFVALVNLTLAPSDGSLGGPDEAKCPAFYQVHSADLTAGEVDNSVTVSTSFGQFSAPAAPVEVIEGGVDLQLTIEASQSTATLGDTIFYTITMRNAGGLSITVFSGQFFNQAGPVVASCLEFHLLPRTLTANDNVPGSGTDEAVCTIENVVTAADISNGHVYRGFQVDPPITGVVSADITLDLQS
jgi:uncharacterized repeat protein (TIGR01451 family)